MNIGIVSDHYLDSGGAVNFAEIELQTIKELEKNYSKTISFNYIFTNKKVYKKFKGKNYNVIYFNKNSFLNRTSLFLNKISLIRKLVLKLKLNFFQNLLKKKNINFLIFVTPSKLVYYLRYIDFVTTVWEIQHKSSPSLKEYKNPYYDLLDRDEICKFISLYSYKIFVGTKKSRSEFSKYFNCDQKRFVIKMTPSLIIETANQKNIKFNENKIGNYLFYPAQFWSHKNHLYIIEAFLEFKKRNIDIKCVFVGSDKGYLKVIKEKISKYELEDYFVIKDYLSNEDIVKLYLNCKAVVVPSIVGTYTFPHIEGFYFEKVVFSNRGNLDEIFHDKIVELSLDNPKSFVTRYLDFLEDKEGKFKKMIKINKNFYDENISVSHNKNIYKNVLDQYLSEIVS